MAKLTLQDLFSCENTGFGYVGHGVRSPVSWAQHADPYACVRACDESVLYVANERGLSRAELHEFMQSRPARHLGDFLEQNLQCTQVQCADQINEFFVWAAKE